MTDIIIIPATPDPRDLQIVSDSGADARVLARLAPDNDLTRRAAAGLLVDLARHVVGRLSAVDRQGREVPMETEIADLRKVRV